MNSASEWKDISTLPMTKSRKQIVHCRTTAVRQHLSPRFVLINDMNADCGKPGFQKTMLQNLPDNALFDGLSGVPGINGVRLRRF